MGSKSVKVALSPRDGVLHDALRAVSQRDNETAYGTGNSFAAAARIKAAIYSGFPEGEAPQAGDDLDIAITGIAIKLARSAGSGFTHQDSAADLCGYAAWAYQLATKATP